MKTEPTELSPKEIAQALKAALAKKARLASGKTKKRSPAPQSEKEWEIANRGKTKKCPSCGKTKDIIEEFGGRRQSAARPNWYTHGWCHACRSGTNYHAMPRKYHTVNSD